MTTQEDFRADIPQDPITDIDVSLEWIASNVKTFSVKDEVNYFELLAMRNEVDLLRRKYDACHEQLSAGKANADRSSHFEMIKKFIVTTANINTKLAAHESSRTREHNAANPPPATAVQPSCSNPPQAPPALQGQGFKLPEIPLPKFSGDFNRWLDFQSAFSSIVVDNPSVTDEVKYQYLKQVLSGEALNRVANVPAGDFKLAWASLRERYDNPMLIADTHVSAILQPPALNAKSATSWRTFIDHTKMNINALESLDLGIPIKDLLYMYIIISKFDAPTLRDWERFNSTKQKTSLENLWAFMEMQHKVSMSISFSFANHEQNSQKATSSFTNKQFSQPHNSNNKNSNPSNHKNFNFQKALHCYFCKDPQHRVFYCPSFLKLAPTARLGAVKEKNLCKNCMRPFSRDHTCQGACQKCGKPHHTMLHEAYANKGQSNGKSFANSNSIQSRSTPVDQKDSCSCSNESMSDSRSSANPAGETRTRICNPPSPIGSINGPSLSIDAQQSAASRTDTAVNQFVSNSACNSSVNVSQCTSIAILPTAEVIVLDAQGNSIACRALLDTGSDTCLITENLAARLALPTLYRDSLIHTVSGNSTKATVVHSITVESSNKNWSSTIECLVVNKITLNLPPFNLDVTTFSVPKNVELADPNFFQSSGIDLLLSASVFGAVMSPGQIMFGPTSPILQNTVLGWVIFGSLQLKQPSARLKDAHVNFISSIDVSNQLEKFWHIEELPQIPSPNSEAVKVENHYNQNTVRLNDGRFMVSLPRKDNFFSLGHSEFQARKRFSALENKLSKHPELKRHYVDFMDEYQELGHMSPVSPPDAYEKVYYIPHHAVFKPDSTTTKLRVVFDASAKTNTGTSLNELLFKGPTVQPDLFDIVLRFRLHKVAFTADIAKMYRQVLLHPDDRNFHRIFWRSDPSLPVQEFCLNTITYGTAPAAFLATRTLNKVAELESEPDSQVFKSIHQDFYVDDCISGSPTTEQAIALAHNLIDVLSKGGFELRKFRSSSSEVINSIPPQLVETSDIKPVSDADNGVTKALGLFWHSQLDKLSIDSNVNENLDKASFTKRELLSVIASIYDPLGLISPVVVIPKMLLQKLWLLKLNWDDKLPFDLLVEWLEIFRQLPDIAKISIPRCVLTPDSSSTIEIHGFSDASVSAYGACIYVRSISNKIQTRLLCSKSRVAPLKYKTIPRLELQAALLLARLVNRVVAAFKLLNIHISQTFLWSDSTTVCSWIRTIPDHKDAFVATRVAEIQETTAQYKWSHVKGSNNPADIVSRGSVPADLSKSDLWWHGPTWLAKSHEHWDSFSTNFVISTAANVTVVNRVVNPIFSRLIDRISSSDKIIRITAYIVRFIHNLRQPNNRLSGELLVTEIQDAEIRVIQSIQEEVFGFELKQLRAKEKLDSRSSLHSLSPFIHDDNLLRVGGRLMHADVPFDFQHQILLPGKHKFTKALVLSTHRRQSHATVQATMASIRQRFWIPATRRVVKSILHSCIKCFRFSHTKSEQLMGQLPAVRVGISAPFLNVGVDYMGPISLRLGGPKSRSFSKAHIALFICMTTRAVHLEVVTELSTKAFLAALTRFASIRGIPNSIYSDNGTAFTGANNELRELSTFLSNTQNQESLQRSASNWRIQWNFIPPRAPHFGGLWERNIRSFKNVFKVVTCKQVLNFEELYTLSAQIGAILNSRPIVPLSEDPLDLAYLSPGHFLIGRPLNALPVKQPQSKHVNHIERWLKISEMSRQLWERWSQEYLVTLQKRHKWTSSSVNITVGTLVLLKDQGAPPAAWKLGRITEVIFGDDAKVRVVMVLTDSGIFKRSLAGIAPLPIENSLGDDQL